MSQQPLERITIYLNDTPIHIAINDLREIIGFAIPPYMRDSKMEAPDVASDIIRSGIKTAAALTLNKLLFEVYGANAPKVGKREDKLPYVFAAITDFLIKKLIERQVVVYVEEQASGAYQVVGSAAIPLPAITAGTVEGEITSEPASTTITA